DAGPLGAVQVPPGDPHRADDRAAPGADRLPGVGLAVEGVPVRGVAQSLDIPSILSDARDFFWGSQPTAAGAIRAAELTLAVLTAALLAWPAARLAAAARRLPRPRARTFAGAAALAAGLTVLAVGVAYHLAASTVVLDGGSLREAGQQL